MELSDKALNTLLGLRNAVWLNNDAEILQACEEVAKYLKEEAQRYEHVLALGSEEAAA